MAIDFDSEMAKLVAAKGRAVAEFQAPDLFLTQVIRHGDVDDFRNFFKRYAMNGRKWKCFEIDGRDSMFGPRWMARFEPAHLKWLYHLLVAKDSLLEYTAKLVADRRIAVERRAFCFHAVFSAVTQPEFATTFVVLPRFWWYNRGAWYYYIRSVKRGSEEAFVKRLGCTLRRDYAVSDVLRRAAESDSVPLFEMNRELENRQVCDSLLQFLIRCNAAKCFVFFLANHPAKVFKLRSPREWLLTVCRCAGDELAVAAVNELERQFPGIVGSTRDPWGGSALWSTFCKLEPKEKLWAELLRFGCDPDGENEWGITPRLLLENAP